MTKGATGRGDAAPPASGDTGAKNDRERQEYIAAVKAHFEILEAAGTMEEWNDVVSEILAQWLRVFRVTQFGGSPVDLELSEAARLSERVRAGFKGAHGRPKMTLTARQDANFILRNCSNRDGSARISNFLEAVRLLANMERIPQDQARKRVIRAEQELGFKLPRSLRQFPKRRK
jgi:hypothetical protein